MGRPCATIHSAAKQQASMGHGARRTAKCPASASVAVEAKANVLRACLVQVKRQLPLLQ
jgi:hypothetical protein